MSAAGLPRARHRAALERAAPAAAAEQVKAIGDGLMLRCSEPRSAILLGLRLVDELAGDSDFPPVRELTRCYAAAGALTSA